jgi:hypothetical protein
VVTAREEIACGCVDPADVMSFSSLIALVLDQQGNW